MTEELRYLMAGVLVLLVIASVVGFLMSRRELGESGRAGVKNFNARTRSWWAMVGIFGLTLVLGPMTTVVLFALLSFMALREFVTINKTRQSDHHVLFWSFFIILPLQYFLVAIQWHNLFSIFIPVYAFIFIPIRKVLTGDVRDYLATTAKVQWGLLVCVYFVSHMPMLLALPIAGWAGKNAALLFFFVMVVQASDVFQYVWGKCLGRHKVAPLLSPNKTWEGTLGGIGTSVLVAAGLSFATPFNVWQAALMGLLICLAGFFGGLVMSAIKRDLGAKDWGQGIAGHGGVLDRIDSLCFAAPLFFHMTKFYFGTGISPPPPAWILRFLGN